MKLKTVELKSVLHKALKGAGNNTFMPITCFCYINEYRAKKKFSITTTDGINMLIAYGETVSETTPTNPVNCVVDLKSFSQLILKTTSEFVTLFVANDTLTVKANGVYNIQLPLDENDEQVVFPTPFKLDANCAGTEIYADNIKDVIKTNKAALSKTGENPELMGYMFAEKAITTDSMIITANLMNVFGHEVMFATNVVENLTLFDDCIAVHYTDNQYIFEDDNLRYFVYSYDEADGFPLDAVNNLINYGFENSVDVDAEELYSALGRLSLFVSPYDSNGCIFNVEETAITIVNQNGTCSEKIAINDGVNFTFKINIDFLMKQLKTMQKNIHLMYGNESCIGLIDEETIRIIALQH